MLQSVLGQYSVPKESFASVCVIVDKVFFYILNSLNLLWDHVNLQLCTFIFNVASYHPFKL